MAELLGFRARGHEVWLLAPAESEIFKRARVQNISVRPLPCAKWKFPFAVWHVAHWLRSLRPDILNTHSSRDGWLVGISGRLAQVPFILRTRHFDVPIPNRQLSAFVYRRLADHVLTTSPKVTAHFKDYFQLSDHHVSTLATGVDTNIFSPQGEIVDLAPEAREKNLLLVGMVSVVRWAKGHKTLLEAAHLLRTQAFAAHYVIVGDGPGLNEVKRTAQEMQLSDCITFTGHREDVPAVLRALNLLAMPSLHEGVPQIVLQALATKTPVVGSDVGGIPEIIRHGETGRLFPAGDAKALANAIRNALTESETTRAMTERGRALVENYYSLDKMLETIDALYRRHLTA